MWSPSAAAAMPTPNRLRLGDDTHPPLSTSALGLIPRHGDTPPATTVGEISCPSLGVDDAIACPSFDSFFWGYFIVVVVDVVQLTIVKLFHERSHLLLDRTYEGKTI